MGYRANLVISLRQRSRHTPTTIGTADASLDEPGGGGARGSVVAVPRRLRTLSNVHISTESLVAALREAGLRVTAPRRAVCEIVARDHDAHLTAAAISERLEGDVDQSTVYRTLDALQDVGILEHTHLGHGASVYHLAGDEPHQHVVCESCGRVVSLDTALFDGVVARILEETGFEVDPTHFALSGRCEDCTTAPDR